MNHFSSNNDISSLFNDMATSLTLQDEKKHLFRILAYKKAAETIKTYPNEMFDLWKEKRLTGIPGIGEGMRGHLEELFKTGHVKEIERNVKKFPYAVYFLQNVRGIGPRTALVLANLIDKKHGNAETRNGKKDTEKLEKIILDKLIQLCKEHKIAKIEGFGEKSESDILESVLKYRTGIKKNVRVLLSKAIEAADKFVEYMKQCRAVEKIETLGSLRRRTETVGDIDIAASSEKPAEVIDYFINYKYIKSVKEKGENKASIEIGNGMQIDLRVIDPAQWGTMLAHFTGSKEHNVALREYAMKQGLSISEYGVKISSKVQSSKCKVQNGSSKLKVFTREEEFYEFLGMRYIPPEMRENTGEIEAALRSAQGNNLAYQRLLTLMTLRATCICTQTLILSRLMTWESLLRKRLSPKQLNLNINILPLTNIIHHSLNITQNKLPNFLKKSKNWSSA